MLFGLMREIGPLASVGLCFLLLLVLLHVAGNAIGTALRDEASRDIESNEMAPLLRAPAPLQIANSPSRLRERTPLGWSVFVLTALGAALGGSLSSLAYAYWTDVNAAGLIVGAVSSAIVGGFFGFLSSSFLKIVFRAWRQAAEIPNLKSQI
ncbi:MAG TPA: hypothetical protein VG056_10110 [Pirellulales bacterium]|jgi:hypothetical protein|nr:hypothetical protein [Pirellulales bacterium]